MSGWRGMWLIVRRSLRQHALSTCITAGSIALGCGLLMAVMVIRTQAFDAFTSGNTGFDGVIGPRGSQLQIVLNSVFHLEQSTGKIPWKRYLDVKADRRIRTAIPYAVGDNYKGFRIVGTVPEMFTEHEVRDGESFGFQGGGRVFDPQLAEAVIGSFVAQKTGLTTGSEFHTYHGLRYDERTAEQDAHKDLIFKVVGVLKPTNTPADRAIWIPLEGYYRMPGHALYGTGRKFVPQAGQAIPEEHKEVSAIMVKLRGGAGFGLQNDINLNSKDLTLAWPIGQVMKGLFDKVAWVNRILALVAYMVIVVAAGSILASVYNTMNERRRQFAILRALGASRGTVFGVIVIESAAIAAIGAAASFAVYGVLLAVSAVIIREQTGVVLDALRYDPVLVLAPLGVVGLGALTGVVPAFKAYSTDVAANILPTT